MKFPSFVSTCAIRDFFCHYTQFCTHFLYFTPVFPNAQSVVPFFYFFLTFFSFLHPLHEWQRLQQPHPSPPFFRFPIYKSARMIHKRIHPSTIRSNACNPLKRRFLLSDKPRMPSATQPHTEAPRQEMPACRFPSHASLPQ